VPSCDECNRSWAADGDYARLAIVMSAAVESHPAANAVAETAQRSLARPEQAGFTQSFLAAIQPRPVIHDGRAEIPSGSALTVDAPRIHRFAARVIQGLYCSRTGTRLPDSHEAICFWLDGIAPNKALAPSIYAIAEQLASLPATTIGAGAFGYRFLLEPSVPHLSFWLLHFYERLVFLGATQPRGGA
jgi:hypothetical protein